MTQDEIISMARAAGFRCWSFELDDNTTLNFVTPVSAANCLNEVDRFAAIIAAKAKAEEREECAKDMDRIAESCRHEDSDPEPFLWAAAMIRARVVS